MGLKNYTTTVPANRTIGEIQEMLASHGASGILLEYDKDGSGRISELAFKMEIEGNTIAFRLPLRWREAAVGISKDMTIQARYRNRALKDEDYAYRVTWRIMRDWIAAQMAILDLEMVQMQEIFLPYAITKNNKTLFETLADDPARLLGSGN